jgi:hypothetical protein
VKTGGKSLGSGSPLGSIERFVWRVCVNWIEWIEGAEEAAVVWR